MDRAGKEGVRGRANKASTVRMAEGGRGIYLTWICARCRHCTQRVTGEERKQIREEKKMLVRHLEQLKTNYHMICDYWNVVRRTKRDAARQAAKGRPEKEVMGRARGCSLRLWT